MLAETKQFRALVVRRAMDEGSAPSRRRDAEVVFTVPSPGEWRGTNEKQHSVADISWALGPAELVIASAR